MPAPVKISDRLLARAKDEAKASHRSVTAQIEHWATLGRAVETLSAHRDVLMLKRAGEVLSMPTWIRREDVEDVLQSLVDDPDRQSVTQRIRTGGGPLYEADPDDPDDPDGVIEIATDGRRTRGHFEGRTFVPAAGRVARKPVSQRERSAVRVAARRRR
jgi:ParD-like antitoxin of type II bacterial toxin-antitoxin system